MVRARLLTSWFPRMENATLSHGSAIRSWPMPGLLLARLEAAGDVEARV